MRASNTVACGGRWKGEKRRAGEGCWSMVVCFMRTTVLRVVKMWRPSWILVGMGGAVLGVLIGRRIGVGASF